MYRFLSFVTALSFVVLPPLQAQPESVPASIAAALTAPDRPKADTDRDALRHPAALIAFAGVKSGGQVADLMPGKGYFTRIFSNVVGPTGHVYAIVPAELAAVAPKIPEAMKALAADPAFANVTSLTLPAASVRAPVLLDLAWTSDNYHDLYGYFGAAQAAAFDHAVFAALKPGGTFVIEDHVAEPGSGARDAGALHRIDPELVRKEVTSVGFIFAGETQVLRNPADNHTLKVFDPAIRGHTDQFVMKFRKPI